MNKVDKYLRSGQRRVSGWLDPFSAHMIAFLSDLQRQHGVEGSVAEIGVHHGKLFLLLHLGADPGSKSLAIDVFEDQHLNLDSSGHGNYERFVDNVRRWAGSIENVEIVKSSSLEITPNDILSRVGRVRMFSVDGGHTAQCAFNDLCLAENTLADNGIVILDDYFNACWPDVSVGANKFLEKPSAIKPFAISPNKVFLAEPEAGKRYRDALRARFKADLEFTNSMGGFEVDIYGMPLDLNRVRHGIRKLGRVNPKVTKALKFLRATFG